MPGDPRLTPQTVSVLRLLLQEPGTPRYGRDIARHTGLKTGTLHPILARLEQTGWLDSFWEDPAAHEDQGRPRRRYYRLTDDGTDRARAALAASHTGTSTARAGLRPRPGY